MDGYHIHFTYNGRLPHDLLIMNGYHSMYLQLVIIIASSYNERLPWHLLSMDGYHINCTYNLRLPQPLLILNGSHNIYLQWVVTTTSTYNGRLPHTFYLQ